MKFCLGLGLGQLKSEGSKCGPFALVLHAYAAAATYAKARLGLGQLKSEGRKWKLTSEGSEGRV